MNAITVTVVKGTEQNEDTQRYGVVTGNRRFEAVKSLNHDTIKALVLE
jgi:ParB-like chromosome segregation protein Spo0J